MNWPYWLDRSLVAFSEVLAVAIGVAVGGMGIWHWYLVSPYSPSDSIHGVHIAPVHTGEQSIKTHIPLLFPSLG